MISHKVRWRIKLLHWHRRIGIILGVFLCWMIITGVLLNHDTDLALDQTSLTSDFWLKWYGVAPQQSLTITDQSVRLTTEGLLLGEQKLGTCSLLLGMVKQPTQITLACSDHLWLLTPTGELIDQLDQLRGLNTTFTALATATNAVYLQNNNQVYRLNPDDMSLSPASSTENLSWQEPIHPGSNITLERWLLDAHSGRLLGGFGKWLVDGLSLALMVLVISGWVLARKRRHLPKH